MEIDRRIFDHGFWLVENLECMGMNISFGVRDKVLVDRVTPVTLEAE